MKRFMITSICLLLLLVQTTALEAQSSPSKNAAAKNGSQNHGDTSATLPKTSIDKHVAQGDAYLKMAAEQKNFLKAMFPSNKGDTVYAVIAGIDYRDPNLKILKQKMDGVKNTKGLTSGYHQGTVIIKILYKPGDASTLYDNLDDNIKALFEVEDMEGSRMILNYKLAKASAPMVEKNQ